MQAVQLRARAMLRVVAILPIDTRVGWGGSLSFDVAEIGEATR